MQKMIVAALCMAAIVCNAEDWETNRWKEEMTGGEAVLATVGSENSLDFKFPYSGPNRGWLTVRKHPSYGTHVYLTINQGQILCSPFDCPIRIRFDESKPIMFRGTEPADHDSTMVFVGNAKRFIQLASKAKTIFVQFNAYGNGAPVLEFQPMVPLAWPPK